MDVLLSQGGAHIDEMDEMNEYTALHYACKLNHISTALLLIDRGADSHAVIYSISISKLVLFYNFHRMIDIPLI